MDNAILSGMLYVFAVGIVPLGSVALLWWYSDYFYGRHASTRHVALMNAQGQPVVYSGYFYADDAVGSEHVRIQKQLHAHADGNPFYCNTFTGWRRLLYDVSYKKKVRSALTDGKVKRKELQQSQNVNLETQLLQNRRKSGV